MFKKLFRQSKATEDIIDSDEEPARFSAPSAPPVNELKKRVEERVKHKGGFDPYNSGTFQKENAWERVTRK